MDHSPDLISSEVNGNGRKDTSTPSSSSSPACANYRLFDRKLSVHQIFGGGKAADVFLWKSWQASFGVIVIATIAWLVFEHSGLSFLSVCSDILLILIVILFFHSNYATLRNKQLEAIPELELSEEMVTSAAASVRTKINYVLLMAHDITLGKDFRLFFKVVICLWLLSVVGSYFSFFTLAYIGTIISITVPALYSRYEDLVDKQCGVIQRKLSKHYKIVDDSVMSRFSRLSKDKDT